MAKAPIGPDNAPVHVAPSPHISNTNVTIRGIMWDVLVALVPVLVAAMWFFGVAALLQVAIATVTCTAGEWIGTRLRGRQPTLADGSAAITGVILGLSLPWSAPWYVAVIAGLVAILIGKVLFGGLGMNMFNPAMVGRAFVMISFSAVLAAPSFIDTTAVNPIVSGATPLTAVRDGAQVETLPSTWQLLLGAHNSSLGESSILAVLLGGVYLCWRRAAAWEIPAAILATVAALAALGLIASPTVIERVPSLGLGINEHLFAGALVFGAFYIATDPVSSPLTRRGKIIYGILIGGMTWILRVFSSYPEGVMFAVLFANATTPLINRWTVPHPVGGPIPPPQPTGASA